MPPRVRCFLFGFEHQTRPPQSSDKNGNCSLSPSPLSSSAFGLRALTKKERREKTSSGPNDKTPRKLDVRSVLRELVWTGRPCRLMTKQTSIPVDC